MKGQIYLLLVPADVNLLQLAPYRLARCSTIRCTLIVRVKGLTNSVRRKKQLSFVYNCAVKSKA